MVGYIFDNKVIKKTNLQKSNFAFFSIPSMQLINVILYCLGLFALIPLIIISLSLGSSLTAYLFFI